MVNWKEQGNPFLDFTEEITQRWMEKGFNKDSCKEWIDVGIKPVDVDFVTYLKKKGFSPQIIGINLAWLREEYDKESEKEAKDDESVKKKEDSDYLSHKTILLIGRTGRGKSTLANVITNTDKFKENSGSVSETKEIQTENFRKNDLNYLIVDTPGIGDTQLSTEEVLDTIAEAVYLVRDGVSQVFFVTNGRFEQYEMATYDLLRIVIFDKDITDHTTITRTHFKSFKKLEKCQDDIVSMIKGGGKLAEIINSCQKKVIHVDNPTLNIITAGDEDDETKDLIRNKINLNREKRDKSGEKLLNYLSENCLDIYKPPKLKRLGSEISKYMESKKKLEEELQEKLKKKKLRRLRAKMIGSRGKDSKSETPVTSAEDTDKSKSIIKEEKEQENNSLNSENKDIERRIKELENEKRKLKEQIQEKENFIRERVFKHIFNNYDEIVNIEGGHVFISNIRDNSWGKVSEEIIKNNNLISEWLSKSLNNQQKQKLVDDLKTYFGSDYSSFCFWLINKQLTAKEASKAIEISENNIEIEHDIDFGHLISEYLHLDLNEYLYQLEKDKEKLKAELDLKNRQNWQLLNIIQHLQGDFDKWTSGNSKIDEFIQEHQLKANNYDEILEWIPYSQFTNIEYLAEGGFSKVYKAEWVNGPIRSWNIEKNSWERKNNKKVALKILRNSQQESTTDFLQEIACHKLFNDGSNVISCFGISHDSQVNNYLMVVDYISDGNLRQYLNENRLDFEDKLYQLYTIALGLNHIHDRGLVHRDFHPGNILVDDVECYITDLGLSREVNETDEGKIYGVLPYVAPEVLRGQSYTYASDIYSFAMVAYELFASSYPYSSNSNDFKLTLEICKGLRPNLDKLKLPQLLKDLISQCWDTDLSKRPTINQLNKILYDWYEEINDETKNSEFYQQYQEIKKEYNQWSQNALYKISLTEILSSKLINTKKITELLENSEENNISKSVEFSMSKLQEVLEEIKIDDSNQFSTPIEFNTAEFNQVNWEEITRETTNWTNLNFTPSLINEWRNQGFSSSQTTDWLSIGLQPHEPHFAAYLRDQKHLTPETALNQADYEQLKSEYQNYQAQQEQPPKH